VIAIARRGPSQRAYTDVEIQAVAANLDQEDLRAELERVRPALEAVGEDLVKTTAELTRHCGVKSKEGESPTRLRFRFLSSPTEVVLNGAGQVEALRVEQTILVERGTSLAAKGTGTFVDIPCDTVIFAIGDRVDEKLGLPCTGTEYVRNPHPDPLHPGDEAYQVYDPASGTVQEGLFVIGWSRSASDGVVGKAKLDGERGMAAVNRYLERVTPGNPAPAERLAHFRSLLEARGVRAVTYPEVQKLEAHEQQVATEKGLEAFKYATDEEMLTAIGASA